MAVERGGWYTDPFERAGERWWDGRGWTDQVREASEGEGERPAHQIRIAGSAQAAAAPAAVRATAKEHPLTFLPMGAAVRQMARLIPAEPEPSVPRRVSITRAHHSYELLATTELISTLEGQIALLTACAVLMLGRVALE